MNIIESFINNDINIYCEDETTAEDFILNCQNLGIYFCNGYHDRIITSYYSANYKGICYSLVINKYDRKYVMYNEWKIPSDKRVINWGSSVEINKSDIITINKNMLCSRVEKLCNHCGFNLSLNGVDRTNTRYLGDEVGYNSSLSCKSCGKDIVYSRLVSILVKIPPSEYHNKYI